MDDRYARILHHPRPVSQQRLPMPVRDRAAQFASFAALSGYGEAVAETARLTEAERILDESEQEILGRKLWLLSERLGERHTVRVTWFQPDARKVGGAYLTVTGIPYRVDEQAQQLILEDETVIPFEKILSLTGVIFIKPGTGS